MLIYSKRTVQFIADIKAALREILRREIGLRVSGARFYDRAQRYSYPLEVVIFNDRQLLGYFDPEFLQLGFHACLMHASPRELQQVIRHELAHYLLFINGVEDYKGHGTTFREFCLSYGWGEEVYRASMTLAEDPDNSSQASERVLRKIKKLIALSESDNEHEAEQAMLKSRQLLLKHNIDSGTLEEDDQAMYVMRLLKSKRRNAKMEAICRMLSSFFVNCIYSYAGGSVYLEVLGTRVNLEIADYVAQFLDRELERLWTRVKREHPRLRGAVAKNSYFAGIATGYLQKIAALQRHEAEDAKQALLVIEGQLEEAKRMVYPNLRSMGGSRQSCAASTALGQEAGSRLNIQPGLNTTASTSGRYLT